jgi:glucose/arabinose dehydrogenase
MWRRIFNNVVFIVVFNILGLLVFKATFAETHTSKSKIEKIGTVFLPWGLAILNPYEVLVTTKVGKLFLFNLDKKTKTLVSGTPRSTFYRQGGLLDVAVQKGQDGNYIFLCYSKLTANQNLTVAISKSKLFGNKLIETRDIFTSNHMSKSGVHFGCRLALKDLHVFASLGDRGDRTNAQNPNNHAGSIIRIPLHGKKTIENPGWLSEIYSIGHRNPQGLHFQKSTGQLWSHEHGPRGGDEINIVNKNHNYGWPIISYGKEYIGGDIGLNYSPKGFTDPIWIWTPSIAPSGLTFYEGKMFKEFSGKLLVGALKYRCIYLISLIHDQWH